MKIGEAINQGVTAVTKDWTKYRKKEYRDAASAARWHDKMLRGSVREESIKDIAYEIMAEAFMKASGGGQLPAAARQIMYQARPLILAQTDKKLGKEFAQYFTQQLLPGYMMEYPDETASWDVVFDARGHLWEPHTGREIQLGTLAVRKYVSDTRKEKLPIMEKPNELSERYPTLGPANRFKYVLFIEKEGFAPLLEHAQIAERYDLAIMSTKGLASTAARSLMERLPGVLFLVLHDFDKGGFSIVGTLQHDTDRFQFENFPEVIDLGLRLEDIKAEGLEAEPVHYSDRDPRSNLHENGATEAEIEFLVTGRDGRNAVGQRVELNAFASDQFISWLERKLKQHAVKKLVPDDEVLAEAYQRAVYTHFVNTELKKIHLVARKTAEAVKIPKNLHRAVNQLLREDPTLPWDAAIARKAREDTDVKREAPGKSQQRSHSKRRGKVRRANR